MTVSYDGQLWLSTRATGGDIILNPAGGAYVGGPLVTSTAKAPDIGEAPLKNVRGGWRVPRSTPFAVRLAGMLISMFSPETP